MRQFFDIESYYSRLKTRSLGRPCIYLEQVESTIDVAAGEPPNTIVLAGQQTKGRGQRNNSWQSPAGCAMGSLRLACKKVSPLGSRLCFLQHIMALVAAKTLEQIDERRLGMDQIRLKWPNDIIYSNPSGNPLKIGGILVHTKELDDEYDITLSFGLNVFNSEPTTCIRDIIGADEGSSLTIDSVVADMMNNLEKYTRELDHSTEDFNSPIFDQLKMDYTERCLQINKLVDDEINGRVRVKAVNNDGFLVGERCADQKLVTVTKISQEK